MTTYMITMTGCWMRVFNVWAHTPPRRCFLVQHCRSWNEAEKFIRHQGGTVPPRPAWVGVCTHNEMVERKDDAEHAYECADCGYVYGKVVA